MMDFNGIMNNEIYMNMINQDVCYIKKIAKKNGVDSSIYETMLVLGSGLSSLIDEMDVHFEIEYKYMPFMPVSTVKGHSSKFVFGKFNNKNIVVMSGRFHYYEGYHLREITIGQRVLHSLGIKKIILTNASGAINLDYNVGDIMIFKSHINLTGINPLIGENLDEYGERFPDINRVYNEEIIDKVYSTAKKDGINIHKGIYAFCPGPSYETTAEVDALRILGADARAMSTVPEIVVCAHSKMKMLAFSCITNVSCKNSVDTHEAVVENAKKASENMKKVLKIALEVI